MARIGFNNNKFIMILFFLIIFYRLSSSFYVDLHSTEPGKTYSISKKFDNNIDRIISDCSCFRNINISGETLSFDIFIENEVFFFPKRIYIVYSDSQIDTLIVNGIIKKLLPEINYYFSSTCKKCDRIREYIMKISHENDLYVNLYDINNEIYLKDLLGKTSKYNIEYIFPNVITYNLKNNEFRVLNGEDEIYKHLLKDLKHITPYKEKYTNDSIKEYDFSYLLIITSGLLDGINPCAFSVIVLLLSFITYFKIGRKKYLTICLSYILGIFITYLLFGLGLSKILIFLNDYPKISIILDIIILSFLLLIILFTLSDITTFIKNRSYSSAIIQIPKRLKLRLHNLFRKNLKKKYIFLVSFIVGINVSVIEGICTGQIYIPVLRLMVKDNFNIRNIFQLMLYNIMFVTPILIIVISYYFMKKIKVYKVMSKKYYLLTKFMIFILLSIFFILLINRYV